MLEESPPSTERPAPQLPAHPLTHRCLQLLVWEFLVVYVIIMAKNAAVGSPRALLRAHPGVQRCSVSGPRVSATTALQRAQSFARGRCKGFSVNVLGFVAEGWDGDLAVPSPPRCRI